MSTRLYPGGFGGTAGDDPLATATDIYVYAESGTTVYFVDSETGSDSTGDGTRQSPYATVAYANSLAGQGDVIVVFAGHEEEVTSNVAMDARVIIIGEGEGDDRPLFTPNLASNADMWTLTAAIEIRNCRFAASSQANTSPTIDATSSSAQGTRISYCEFSCGQYDDGTKVAFYEDGNSIGTGILRECTFISEATSQATRPSQAVSGVRWAFGCTFTGGTYGWQNSNVVQYGWDNSASGPVGFSGHKILGCQLSDGAYLDAFVQSYHDGLGMIGHPLIANPGLHMSVGDIRYVNSDTGTDSAGYGRTYDRPYASLKYAINTGASDGLIIVAAGHTELIAIAGITADDTDCIIVGEGNGDNRPQITRAVDAVGLTFSSSLVGAAAMCNVRWSSSAVSSSANRVAFAQEFGVVHNCEFQCSENDAGATLYHLNAPHLFVWNTQFISDATDETTLPVHTIETAGTDNLMLDGVSWDGAEFGWDTGYAAIIDASYSFSENLSIVRDSEIILVSNGAYTIDFFVQVSTTTGRSGVVVNTAQGGGA